MTSLERLRRLAALDDPRARAALHRELHRRNMLRDPGDCTSLDPPRPPPTPEQTLAFALSFAEATFGYQPPLMFVDREVSPCGRAPAVTLCHMTVYPADGSMWKEDDITVWWGGSSWLWSSTADPENDNSGCWDRDSLFVGRPCAWVDPAGIGGCWPLDGECKTAPPPLLRWFLDLRETP